jgi:DNA modification methylase
MKINCSYTELVEVHKLIPNPKNPNVHPQKQIDRLAEIISFQGQRHPVIVSLRSGFVVVGHGRLAAIKKLGWEKVAVDYQDFENEAQEYAFVVADNAISEWATLDLSLVNAELGDLGPDFNLDQLGIENFKLEPAEKLAPHNGDDDHVPDVVHPITCKGDVWLLGENKRLMCGDSTMIDNLEKLFNGSRAHVTFTSPPYNAGKNIRGNFYENDSDDKDQNDYTQFLNDFTTNALLFTDFAFVNLQLLESNKKSLIEYQMSNIENLKDILIWNKKQYPPHINKGTFGCKWEYVFCFGQNGKGRAFPCEWQGKFSNVIETENNSGNEFAKEHRAGFPVAFPMWLLEKMDFAKSVYDPFMGTGTTFIAAERLNIGAFGMELDEKYCDIIIKRWEGFTQQKARLESTGQTYEELKIERERR